MLKVEKNSFFNRLMAGRATHVEAEASAGHRGGGGTAVGCRIGAVVAIFSV